MVEGTTIGGGIAFAGLALAFAWMMTGGLIKKIEVKCDCKNDDKEELMKI